MRSEHCSQPVNLDEHRSKLMGFEIPMGPVEDVDDWGQRIQISTRIFGRTARRGKQTQHGCPAF